MNAADYRKQLEKLLPQGLAFKRDPGSLLLALLEGMAEELARIDGRSTQLIQEADPRTADELLEDWLRVVGVPDPCTVYALGAEDEKAQLLQKLTRQVGQNADFWLEIAQTLGYSTAQVLEYREFRVDDNSVGDPLYDAKWKHTFTVQVAEPLIYFRAGEARAGEYLTRSSAELLNCTLQKSKPAHTVAFVGFQEET